MTAPEHRRRSTVSSKGSKHEDEEQGRTSPSSPPGSEVGRVQRHCSQLRSAVRSRVPSIRSQTGSETMPQHHPYDTIETRPRSKSITSSVPDQEQFIDGQVRPSVNTQRPGFVRTFSRSKSTGSQYEAETTPNMAYLDWESLRRSGSLSVTGDPVNDSQAIGLEAPYRRRKMRRVYEMAIERHRVTTTIGQKMVTDATYDIAPLRKGRNSIIEGGDDERPFISPGPRTGNPEVVDDENVRRHKSQKAQFEGGGEDVKQKRNQEGDYFGDSVRHIVAFPPLIPTRNPRRPQSPFSISIRNESVGSGQSRNVFFAGRRGDGCSPAVVEERSHNTSTSDYAPCSDPISSATAEPQDNGHPAFRRQPIIPPPTTTYPIPTISARRLGIFNQSANISSTLPPPATRSSRHSSRWYITLYTWFLRQSRSSLPDEVDSSRDTNLRHDVAPVHWHLYLFGGLIWLGVAIAWVYLLGTVGEKLAFECYELKTQLRLQQENSKSGQSHFEGWELLETDIPEEYRVGSSDRCILTPVNHGAVMSGEFNIPFVTAIMCCGAALSLQAAAYRIFVTVMKADGSKTLLVRLLTQLVASVLGSGVVLSMAWGVVGRKR